MSTTCSFAGVTISGIVIDRATDPLKGRSQLHQLFGLNGATSIPGGKEPAPASVIIHLRGFANESALTIYARVTLGALINTVGTLQFSGSWTSAWTNLQLDSVQQIPHDGQRHASRNNVLTPSTPWTDHVRLNFTQLR